MNGTRNQRILAQRVEEKRRLIKSFNLEQIDLTLPGVHVGKLGRPTTLVHVLK